VHRSDDRRIPGRSIMSARASLRCDGSSSTRPRGARMELKSSARTLTVAVAAATLALTGCGGDGDDDGGATAAGDGDIQLIQEGKLTVCTHLPYEPFQFQDESGEVVG